MQKKKTLLTSLKSYGVGEFSSLHHDSNHRDVALLSARRESVFVVSPGPSPDGRLWTDAQNCTALQADNPPRRIGRRPKSEIIYLNDSFSKAQQDECLMINDLLVGLQNLRDRHGQTQSLAQVSVLLFQGHQAAPKEILVHLAEERKNQQTQKHVLRLLLVVSRGL